MPKFYTVRAIPSLIKANHQRGFSYPLIARQVLHSLFHNGIHPLQGVEADLEAMYI